MEPLNNKNMKRSNLLKLYFLIIGIIYSLPSNAQAVGVLYNLDIDVGPETVFSLWIAIDIFLIFIIFIRSIIWLVAHSKSYKFFNYVVFDRYSSSPRIPFIILIFVNSLGIIGLLVEWISNIL